MQCSADGAAREQKRWSFQRTTRRFIICCLTAMPAQVASRVPKKLRLSDKKVAVYPHEEAINTLTRRRRDPQNNIIAPSSAPASATWRARRSRRRRRPRRKMPKIHASGIRAGSTSASNRFARARGKATAVAAPNAPPTRTWGAVW